MFWDQKSETLDRAALERLQLERLQETVQCVAAHVPFYRLKFAELGLKPEEIRAAYRDSARRRTEALAREANHRRISHALVHTDRPYLDAIEAYLGFRGRNLATHR